MKVRPVNELATNPTSIPVSGIGGFTQALGYAIINVRIEGIGSYNEEQVVLVIEDVSGLGMRVPVILGTPTIHRLCRQLKESEFRTIPDEWQHALRCYEISQVPLNSMSIGTGETRYPTNTGQNPMDLDEQLILTDKVTVPTFSSQIIKVRTKRTYMMGHRLNVMMQPPYPEDQANLPVGLYVQRVYSDLKDGSQNLSTVVRNGTAKPIHLASGRIVGRVVAANAVPDAIVSPELEEKLAKDDGEKPTPMTVEQRQELLMKVLTENGSIGKLDGPGWSAQTALRAKRLLMEFHHVFSLEPNEMGCTDTAEHTIELLTGEDEPFKERFRRIAPHEVEEVRQHIQEMLDGGAIRPSQSPWCNAVVLVRKKDGTLRFCIDFRRLNARTKKDSHPLPRGPETMESLVGARYFSTVDLKSGFWQIKMAEESRQYTAFTVGSLGIYEFLRMPYGLCNAPATFQHLMQNCLGELNLQYALIYLDDVIVYSRTPEEHLKRLQAVLDRFALNGLKLKPSKCHFFKESLTYLGHEISAAGMLPGQEGIQKIAEMGYPRTVTGVRKFIGATGYFRRFIKNYARIAKPLNNLIGCNNAKLKNHPVTLSPEAKDAFNTLKQKCMTAPVLAFADLEKPFLLETDASALGLGAVLQQVQADGKLHPVAYASRALRKGEKNYHSSKLEFLALKWAVTEQFKEYLYYRPFTVRTDNNPLMYILTTPNLDACGHRWVASLTQFNFKIEYLKGTDNKVADVLSRIETCLEDDTVRDLLKSCPTTEIKVQVVDASPAFEDDLPVGEDGKPRGEIQKEAVNEAIKRARFLHVPHAEADNPALIKRHEEIEEENAIYLANLVAMKHVKHNLTGTNWKALQEADPIISHVLKWKRMSESNKTKDKNSRDHRTLEEYLLTVVNAFDARAYGLRQKDLVYQNGLLYVKETATNTTDEMLLFIVPASKRQAALDLCHRDAGHQGRDRTYSLLKERFWWPKMRTQMMTGILNCAKCKVFEKREPRALVQYRRRRAHGSDSRRPVGIGNYHGSSGHALSAEDTSRDRPFLTPRASLQSGR